MQALQGLKVVEVGNILAGPFCGTLMADFGAEVIKVEPPKIGDLMRGMGRIKDLWYCVEGRNKKNITLNLKTEEGKAMLTELIKDADILIQNFRPGVFDKMGFTWEYLHKLNPRLVFVNSSGYGLTGPDKGKPGLDRIGMAIGGFLEITGYPGETPVKPGISVADFYCAMFACIGAMFAIYNRDVVGTGEGQYIDCCLTESMLRLQESILAEYSYDGSIRTRMGNATNVTAPSGHYLTKDGKYLVLTISGDKLFALLCNAIGCPEMITDERYATGPARTAHKEELNKWVQDWVSQRTVDECLEQLGEGVPCCKIYNAADIMVDKQLNERHAIIEMPTEKFGNIKMQGITPKMSGTPGEVNWAGKPLGWYNEEILGGRLGLTPEQLQEYKDKGII